MPQEFQVLQCYKCETFQVHQVKKTTKWQCKLCGEKQSLKKVFGRGTGSECRCHVQKLNTIRGELSTATITTSSSQFVTSQQFDGSRSHTSHRLDDDEDEGTCHNVIQRQQSGNNKWNLFVEEDDSNGADDDGGNYEDNMFTTDASLFKRGKKRKRMNKKSYGEYNGMQRPDQRETDNWQDQYFQKLTGQVNKFNYPEPAHNNRQSSKCGASDKYSTENQFYETNLLDTRQADTYNYNKAPNVKSSYKSSFNTSNSTNSASKWNNFVPVENSPGTQEDENDLADTRQIDEIYFKRESNVTNSFKTLGHEASTNSASKWNNYTPAECSNGDDFYEYDSTDTRTKELNSFKAKSNNFDKRSSKASTNVSSKWNNFVSAANQDPDSDTDEDSLHGCYHGYRDKNVPFYSEKKSNFENFEDSENMNKTVLAERQTIGNVGQLNTGFKNSSVERKSPVASYMFKRKAVESSVKTAALKHSKLGSYVNTSTCENVNKSAYHISGSINKAAGLTFTAGDLTDEDFNL